MMAELEVLRAILEYKRLIDGMNFILSVPNITPLNESNLYRGQNHFNITIFINSCNLPLNSAGSGSPEGVSVNRKCVHQRVTRELKVII
jgi:hypothetical protein